MGSRKNNLIKIWIILILSCYVFINTYAKQNPTALQGILDLRDWKFEENGYVELNGEWEFYWKKLLVPTNIDQQYPDIFISVPDKWSNYKIGNKSLPIYGYATYRLKVLLDNVNDEFQIKIPWPIIPTKCFINGNLIGYNGTVGKNEESSVHEYKFNYNSFRVNSDTLDIILQTANYKYERGGACFTITLGTNKSITTKKQIQSLINNFFLGCIFLMLIYHLILFSLWRKDKSPLYLSLSLFGINVLFFLINDEVINIILPSVNYETILYLSLFPSCLLYGGFILFVYYLFPKEYTLTGLCIILIISTINFAIFGISYSTAIYLKQFFRLLRIIALLYNLFVVILASVRKRTDANTLLIGFVILILAGIVDMLIQVNILNITSPFQMGILFFLLVQSFIVARRFSRAFHKNEQLTKELTHINTNLENIVIKRTNTIEEQKEKLTQLNKMKDRLFAIIGHDLRGPLSSLDGIADIISSLVKKQRYDTLQHVSRQIDQSINSINALLDNLLKWAFIQTNQLIFNPQKIDLNDVLETTIEMLLPVATAKNILISSHINPGATVTADINLLKTVFRNLISNAIKFTPNNGTITVTSVSKDGCIEINIIDNGVGIKENKLSYLFEMRTDKTTNGTNNEKGSGLGLMLCKEFIEMHKGTITVSSKEEEGTVFTFILPNIR